MRGILEYVPQFRDHIFVIALDGSVVAHENFSNVLTDLAVLKSLNIKVVLVHGIGQQIKELAESKNTQITDPYGEGPTDDATLQLAIEASGQVTHLIQEGLTENNLKCAQTNALRGVPIGILKGKDQKLTGKVDKIDLQFINTLLEKDIVPLINPIIFDREGHSLRANSDLLASELALALQASKLIYLTSEPGLSIAGQILMNIPLTELEKLITKNLKAINERIRSKARFAAQTLGAGTPRAHILDGRVFGGLLTEIFDKVGLGTMIHANEYQQIRKARKKDISTIFSITKNAARTEALRYRTRLSIERNIAHFFVYEVDESIIACASLVPLGKSKSAELSSVLVQPFYQGKGVGKKLVEFGLHLAKEQKLKKVIALSTQTSSFFKEVCQFKEGKLTDLPSSYREEIRENGRSSKILVKPIA